MGPAQREADGEVLVIVRFTAVHRTVRLISSLHGGIMMLWMLDRRRAATSVAACTGLWLGASGCGGGDMLRIISSWARRNNIEVSLIGIDANPHIIDYARQNLHDVADVSFLHADIFSNEFSELKFDVVIGTLFFHHFTQDQLIGFFSQMRKQLRVALIINDIHRHYLAYHSIKILTKLLSKSPMVIHDAPLSVERAFSRDDVRHVLIKSGFENFEIAWKWAFRWQVIAYSQGKPS